MEMGLKKIFFLGIVITSISVCGENTVTLSFDTLFPVSWYEKGMRSLLFVWHELKNVHTYSLPFNTVLLGKLAFTHYCIEQMVSSVDSLIQDDRDCYVMVLDKVGELHQAATLHFVDRDAVCCFNSFIEKIKAMLNQSNVIIP